MGHRVLEGKVSALAQADAKRRLGRRSLSLLQDAGEQGQRLNKELPIDASDSGPGTPVLVVIMVHGLHVILPSIPAESNSRLHVSVGVLRCQLVFYLCWVMFYRLPFGLLIPAQDALPTERCALI